MNKSRLPCYPILFIQIEVTNISSLFRVLYCPRSLITMAAAVALEVFGLFVGGLLGIVDLLLPPPEIPTSPLQQGHSLLRFGIGLNSSVPQSLGGTIPSVRVWNEEGVLIGSAVGAASRDIQPGTFKTVEVVHNDSYLFQQPTYLEIAGGSDAVCLAYIAQTWADGTQLGWLGDMGKYCGTQWYYSNLFVSTKNGTYKVKVFESRRLAPYTYNRNSPIVPG